MIQFIFTDENSNPLSDFDFGDYEAGHQSEIFILGLLNQGDAVKVTIQPIDPPTENALNTTNSTYLSLNGHDWYNTLTFQLPASTLQKFYIKWSSVSTAQPLDLLWGLEALVNVTPAAVPIC